jgi:hypothetical protein
MKAIKDIIVGTMVQVLKIFAFMTKEVKLGRTSESIPDNTFRIADSDSERFFRNLSRNLIGSDVIKDALSKLDRLTQEGVNRVIEHVSNTVDRVEGSVGAISEKLKVVGDNVNRLIEGTFSTLSRHILNPHTARWKRKESP